MEQVDLTHPITEDDIANYLIASPDFFERHAEVLAAVQLTSPHSGRAVSLQERQAGMLRDKIKLLESHIVEMVKNAHDNAQLADRLEQWAHRMLRAEDAAELPSLVMAQVAERFDVPQVTLKLWDVAERFAAAPFAQGVGEDAQDFASSLDKPFCGVNPGFSVVDWLDDPGAAVSLALVPLHWQTRAERVAARHAAADSAAAAVLQTEAAHAAAGDGGWSGSADRIEPTLDAQPPVTTPRRGDTAAADTDVGAPACGLLVLASPDARRFQADMGTEYLERLADLAGAALSRLRRTRTRDAIATTPWP